MENNLIAPPPDAPTNGNSPSGGGPDTSSAMPEHTGADAITSDTSITGEKYSSTKSAENALLISGADVTLDDIVVTKTGDDDGDSSDFYGTNAAIFAYDGAKVNISNSTIETNGAHANAVFAYGNATIDIQDSKINTSSNNSGGIMVTGGGTINATDLTVHTLGNSAAAIRSDRGGGTISVDGGTYTSEGVGSPAIYSTADIAVKDAELTATASEGVVIEGKNSVSLEGVRMESTNNKLNSQSQTYKTIFIYQSMSGDASEGTGKFSVKDSLITTNKGDHFFITNTTAEISLSNTKFVQNDATGGFLRAQTGAWGNAGSNGGKVILDAHTQEMIGDITVDKISSLDMQMDYSYFKGALLGEGVINLALSKDSVVVLTADSHLTSLNNELSDNSNIYGNGFKLFVNGTEVATNSDVAPESFITFDESVLFYNEVVTVPTTTTTQKSTGFPVWGYFVIGGIVVALAVLGVVLAIVIKKKKRNTSIVEDAPSSRNDMSNDTVVADGFGVQRADGLGTQQPDIELGNQQADGGFEAQPTDGFGVQRADDNSADEPNNTPLQN